MQNFLDGTHKRLQEELNELDVERAIRSGALVRSRQNYDKKFNELWDYLSKRSTGENLSQVQQTHSP